MSRKQRTQQLKIRGDDRKKDKLGNKLQQCHAQHAPPNTMWAEPEMRLHLLLLPFRTVFECDSAGYRRTHPEPRGTRENRGLCEQPPQLSSGFASCSINKRKTSQQRLPRRLPCVHARTHAQPSQLQITTQFSFSNNLCDAGAKQSPFPRGRCAATPSL